MCPYGQTKIESQRLKVRGNPYTGLAEKIIAWVLIFNPSA